MHESQDSVVDVEHLMCWDQLPWRVNGSLSAAQCELVDKHVERCAECAAELRSQQMLRECVRDHAKFGDAVLLAPQVGWQKMSERLDAGSSAPRRVNSSSMRWAAAVAAVSVAGLALMIFLNARETERAAPRYQTLTSTPDNGAVTQPQLRMVFQRDLPVSEVAVLLQGIPAQIVAGPSEAGVYTVALQENARDAATAELLARLRADRRIVFVEPVASR